MTSGVVFCGALFIRESGGKHNTLVRLLLQESTEQPWEGHRGQAVDGEG